MCQLCDPSCLGGCTGPSKTLGQGGCNTCAVGVVAADGFNITMCLPHDTVHCGKGYFMGSLSGDHLLKMAGKQVNVVCVIIRCLIGKSGNLSQVSEQD